MKKKSWDRSFVLLLQTVNGTFLERNKILPSRALELKQDDIIGIGCRATDDEICSINIIQLPTDVSHSMNHLVYFEHASLQTLRRIRTIVDAFMDIVDRHVAQCGRRFDMSRATFWSIDISNRSAFCWSLSKNVDRQTAVWMYIDPHWWPTQNFLRRVYEFVPENWFSAHNLFKLDENRVTKNFFKSVTLASRFTERSTFNIEVRRILFIIYFVAVKSCKEKRFHTEFLWTWK